MKKIIIAVCVVLCGVTMTSCTDMVQVRNVYSQRLNFEKKIKEYDRLQADTLASAEQKRNAYDEAEVARETYLKAFSHLGESERKEYKKLEAECRSADENYLGSIYEEDNENKDTALKKLQDASFTKFEPVN